MSTCTSYVYNKHAWAHALVMYIININMHVMYTCMNTCTSYVYNKHAWLVMYIITCTHSYVYNKHAWAHALVMYIINMHEHMH